jgi:beta-glucosidase
MKYVFDWKEYAGIARAMAAEGCVLLRNENAALPIRKNEKAAVFGRIQLDYYKSGTGSGGMVNAPYTVNIVEGLEAGGRVQLDAELLSKYRAWHAEHPFDKGVGWGNEPFSQKEMPVSDGEIAAAAERCDIALVIFGRSSGEDRDAEAVRGSWLLSEDEETLLAGVTRRFRRTAVLLNTGAVMDMSWVEKYRPQAVMYVWQGGQEGGNGVADVLTGVVSPSGRLADTIAADIADYPSTAFFGDPKVACYAEDIYVGYRYFETCAPQKVLYPFGFGLSYTCFEQKIVDFAASGKEIRVGVEVMNSGDRAGKEVVQVYYEPPQGKLSKPRRNLIRFGKTNLLAPGESQRLTFLFSVEEMASFDDTGATGNASCFVLEEGDYAVYAGSSVRDAVCAGSHHQAALKVTGRPGEACAPSKHFDRMKIVTDGRPGTADAKITWEPVPVRTADTAAAIAAQRPESAACTGDQGIRLADVKEETATMEKFLSQLTDGDLIDLSRGEGMCSPKVTAGVAAAFGGVTERLRSFGIPVAACSDGPSGIRMDDGTMAFSGPCGTLIACSFNVVLTSQLYDYVGRELRKNRIDALLGPGVNIHRNPLNGRNFEYFSEDPYLAGTMAASEVLAMHRYGVSGTVKHFAGNNQEGGRRCLDSEISARALREIYLRVFEIAVKNGGADCIMTTYGALNGVQTAGSYDLLTTVLRKNWRYEGLVMTDWWADIADESASGGEPSRAQTTAMIRAQNDIYMVCADAASNANGDDSEEGLASGRITRGELMRNAANILSTVMRMPAMDFLSGMEDEIEERSRPAQNNGTEYPQPGASLEGRTETALEISGLHTEAGSADVYIVRIPQGGNYEADLEVSSQLGQLAQMTVSLYENNTVKDAATVNGTSGEHIHVRLKFDVFCSIDNYLKFYFSQDGLKIKSIVVYKM